MAWLGKQFLERKVRVRTLILTVIMLLVAGVVTFMWFRATPLYTVPTALQEPECVTPAPDGDVLVGLTVSGGGSRAALFAAGALEALAGVQIGPERRSLLEHVSYISSVSGGSLASAYFAVRKPTHEKPVLTQGGELTEEYRRFFTDFKSDMSHDFENLVMKRHIFGLRWFNPAWTARSLAEAINEEFMGDIRFNDLARRETEGDSPYLMINTTLYNNGRRFLLTTLPREASRYDVYVDLDRISGARKLDEAAESALRERWESLLSVTPEDIKMDVCPIRVAAAVAGSMSFPPVIGPISIRVKGEDLYWHIGDGGMADNTGVESLLMVFFKKLQAGKARRAVIIALDSSFPFSVGGEALNHQAEGFTFFSYDFSRIPSIMEERATAYRAWFFRTAQRQGLLPDGLKLVVLRHTDAKWEADLRDVPDSCRKEEATWKVPREVVRRLAGVPTRLWLASTCDRDLTLAAAGKVVAQNEEKIRKLLEQ